MEKKACLTKLIISFLLFSTVQTYRVPYPNECDAIMTMTIVTRRRSNNRKEREENK
jgi:hypothetical protein